jgi:hypothetical protein
VRLRVAILLGAVALALAGCGGGSGSPADSGSTKARDPGRDVMTALVEAAQKNDTRTMWALLSRPTARRYGPTYAAFKRKHAPALRRALLPFAGGKLPVQISENIGFGFGVVALARGTHAYAAPMRKEGDFWRVELGGPFRIDVLGPPPNSRGKFLKQIGIETHGPQKYGVALLYLDGVALDAKPYAGPRSSTVYANFEQKLTPRLHTVVAYASSGPYAAARAWTFRP